MSTLTWALPAGLARAKVRVETGAFLTASLPAPWTEPDTSLAAPLAEPAASLAAPLACPAASLADPVILPTSSCNRHHSAELAASLACC